MDDVQQLSLRSRLIGVFESKAAAVIVATSAVLVIVGPTVGKVNEALFHVNIEVLRERDTHRGVILKKRECTARMYIPCVVRFWACLRLNTGLVVSSLL
jgi:hypothetical protein